jgi:hypothetical protein
VPTQLSAILYAPNGLASVRRTIAHLQSQDGPEVELVLAVPTGSLPEFPDFPPLCVRTLEVNPGTSTATAWSLAAQVASSPVVVFTEDHAFPDPGWAEALVQAHTNDWYAVGPSIENANSNSLLSRADMLVNFVDQYQRPEGPSSTLMGHNTSYKKAILLSMDVNDLAEALRCEILLHRKWGDRHCLHLPQACVRHVNISLPIPFAKHKVLGGVVFGGERCRHWPISRRLVYLCGSWAIPLLRAVKIGHALSSLPKEKRAPFLPALAWVGLALILHATGEALGYLVGPKLAEKTYPAYSQFEKHRWDMVRPEEVGLRDTTL